LDDASLAATPLHGERQSHEQAERILFGPVVRRQDRAVGIDRDGQVQIRHTDQVAFGADPNHSAIPDRRHLVTERPAQIFDDAPDPRAESFEPGPATIRTEAEDRVASPAGAVAVDGCTTFGTST
jgi:hypothetical protein